MFSSSESHYCTKALSTQRGNLDMGRKDWVIEPYNCDIPKYLVRFELDLEDHKKPIEGL